MGAPYNENNGLTREIVFKGVGVVIASVIAFIGYPLMVLETAQSDLFATVFGHINPLGVLLIIGVYGIILYVLLTFLQILVGE